MTKMVMGAFRDKANANDAILELEGMGVAKEDFSLFMREDKNYEEEANSIALEEEEPRMNVEGGATVGGSVGGLAGLVFGAITTAGLFVAGPAIVLAGLGWTALTTITGGAIGALTGGFVGALVNMGIPEEMAEEQKSIIEKDGVLIAAEDNNLKESSIRDVLVRNGAEQLASVEHGMIPAKIQSVNG